jgi:hypothetical protein
MRSWIMHPLVFYPLAILLAALVIAISLEPQSWPRPPAPVSGERTGDSLVLERDAFNAPAVGPDQHVTVVRDFWGRPQTLRIAVEPNAPAPGPQDQGVRILLGRQAAAAIAERAVTVVVSYSPLPVNAASGLAIAVEGAGPPTWVTRQAPPQTGALRFVLPPQTGANAIGLRAIASGEREAFGLEITRILVTPHTGGAGGN